MAFKERGYGAVLLLLQMEEHLALVGLTLLKLSLNGMANQYCV